MIRVTIEIYPFGFFTLKRLLGTVDIINDGTGDAKIGNYKIKAHTAHQNRLVRQFEIKNHRREDQSFWQLLKKVFEAW